LDFALCTSINDDDKKEHNRGKTGLKCIFSPIYEGNPSFQDPVWEAVEMGSFLIFKEASCRLALALADLDGPLPRFPHLRRRRRVQIKKAGVLWIPQLDPAAVASSHKTI
jgi:hypothetical protein